MYTIFSIFLGYIKKYKCKERIKNMIKLLKTTIITASLLMICMQSSMAENTNRNILLLKAVPKTNDINKIIIKFECPAINRLKQVDIRFSAKLIGMEHNTVLNDWEWLEISLNNHKWVVKPSILFAGYHQSDFKDFTLTIPSVNWLKQGENILELRSLGFLTESSATQEEKNNAGLLIRPITGLSTKTFVVVNSITNVTNAGYFAIDTTESKPVYSSTDGNTLCYYVLPTELIFPDKTVEHKIYPSSSNAVVRMVKGETEAIQLAVVSKQRLIQNVKVRCGALKCGDAKISSGNISIYAVGYIMLDDKAWPDPLFPQKNHTVTIAPGRKQAWWINVKVPESQKAGIYTGNITLFAADNIETNIPFTVEVVNKKLVYAPPYGMCIGLGVHGNMPVDLCAERHLYPNHSVQGVENVRFLWDNGNIKCDFSAFDKKVEMLRNKYGMKYICLGFCIGDGSRASHKWILTKRKAYDKQGKEHIINIDPTAGSREQKMFNSILSSYVTHLRKKGWLKDAYIYLWDEPNKKTLAEATVKYATYFKQAAPELSIMVVTAGNDFMKKNVDIFCAMMNHVHDTDWYIKNNRRLWIYSCGNFNHPALTYGNPGLDSRIMGWMATRFDAEHTLNWGVDISAHVKLRGPLTLERHPGHGDGCLFYYDPVSGTYIPSIRSENLRDGLDDAMLFSVYGTDQDKKQLKELIPTQYNYDSDSTKYFILRNSILDNH